jgi:FKBP-type peptidyl-prolyl cis-trans isomerase
MLLAASMIFAGYAAAQTSSTPATSTPATTQTPASGTTPTAKSQTGTTGTKTPAAKTGTARTPFTLKTDKDKESYSIGLNIGRSMKKDAVDVDPAVLARGIKDALAGGKTLMTDEEIKTTMTALSASVRKKQEDLHKEQEAKLQAMGAENKTEGEAFLAANKGKDGVVSLPSGLQYKVLSEGTGPKPAAADTVVCNYKGTLINGTEFDSSSKHGGPATFSVGQVIKGWTEALQLMPVGSKWQLFVPSDLAYATRTAGPDIGPNSTLVFEVELLSIQPKAETPAAAPGAKTLPGTPPPAQATSPKLTTPTTTTAPPPSKP